MLMMIIGCGLLGIFDLDDDTANSLSKYLGR